ncbi:glycerol-3-phosphate 1-O-acyltransferase [bacterium]|nr:glycerol-3-phosphate 1-O-acyltransferase [bacterium]
MYHSLTFWLGQHSVLLVALSFLSGSIPFSLIITRPKGINLREFGSGNIGATNVYRALGLKYAVLVFMLDALKGILPTVVAMSNPSPSIHVIVAAAAIAGHSLSPFAGFKGGKGAATGIGVLSVLAFDVFIINFLVASGLILTTRYVAPTSIFCCVITPLLLYFFHYPIEYVTLTTLIGLFIIYRHKANIKRLINGTENRL